MSHSSCSPAGHRRDRKLSGRSRADHRLRPRWLGRVAARGYAPPPLGSPIRLRAVEPTSFRVRPLTIVLVLVALALVAVAVVYFTKSAADLPSYMPGHQAHVTRHHTKHGIAMLGLAVLAGIGA